MSITSSVFSEAEVKEIGFSSTNITSTIVKCVGNVEEEMEQKTITKKCRGVVAKKVTKGTGTGTLKLTLHVPQSLLVELYGMESSKLEAGVVAYGQDSRHEQMIITMRVEDEDGNEKLKAYPNCVISSGLVRKVENGQEEIPELELEIAVSPDEYGAGMYEAVVDDVTDDDIVADWMGSFDSDLVRTASEV